jgi:predicted nucleotidyltransferase
LGIVFGSLARREGSRHSDLDLILVRQTEKPFFVRYVNRNRTVTPELRQRIFEVAWEVGFERDRVISTIVATRDQVQNGAFGANPLVRQIEQEGIHV